MKVAVKTLKNLCRVRIISRITCIRWETERSVRRGEITLTSRVCHRNNEIGKEAWFSEGDSNGNAHNNTAMEKVAARKSPSKPVETREGNKPRVKTELVIADLTKVNRKVVSRPLRCQHRCRAVTHLTKKANRTLDAQNAGADSIKMIPTKSLGLSSTQSISFPAICPRTSWKTRITLRRAPSKTCCSISMTIAR